MDTDARFDSYDRARVRLDRDEAKLQAAQDRFDRASRPLARVVFGAAVMCRQVIAADSYQQLRLEVQLVGPAALAERQAAIPPVAPPAPS